jgi:hypothetical protein
MLNKLQKIDRRILYVIIALVITLPLIARPKRHPSYIFAEVKSAYKTLDNVPKDKLVILSCVWGPGTEAENAPQTEVIMRHLFKKGIKFAVISWDQAGSERTYQIGKQVQQEMGKKYGVDWVHLGYRMPYLQVILRGMAIDFQKVLSNDRFKTPLSEIPAVKNVKTYKDVGAVVDITPSATVEAWIAYYNAPYKIPLVFCPTAVMAAEAYPYLDAKQISGMLNGVIGAVQYEVLIGRGNVRSDAAATALALSSAHIFIILLIIIGNVAYFVGKKPSSKDKIGGRP